MHVRAVYCTLGGVLCTVWQGGILCVRAVYCML